MGGCLKIVHVVGQRLKSGDNIANIANKLPRQFATLFFVGNVGYQFSIANIANKPMAAWPPGRTASVCVGIANIANGPLA
jgi:hypothetical protein